MSALGGHIVEIVGIEGLSDMSSVAVPGFQDCLAHITTELNH